VITLKYFFYFPQRILFSIVILFIVSFCISYILLTKSLPGSAPSGYVDFKFISLLLAIVRIDCTIVRVIEPHRLLVVLRNGILKSVFNLT
jgi:hypothetical protein